MKGSPRPWHYYFDANACTVNDADGREIALLSERNEHPLEDAQAMVQAVNAHEGLVTALRLIAGDRCSNYTRGWCGDGFHQRTPDAVYSSDRWCDACIAREAILAAAAEER